MSKKTLVMDGMSFIYKVTFEDGSSYFQRAADCWSVNSYRNHLISLFNNESRNTEFERKFFVEKSTAKIDIVFKGSTEEAIKVKDRLVSETPDTLNTKVRGNLSHKAVPPLKLKKEFTKAMSSGGDSIIFIDREYGYRMGLKEKMDGYKKHPIYPSFVKLNMYNVERL
jgi:hypothetical protein